MSLTIGDLSRRSGVKVPTIRYYEQIGLLPEPGRSAGNQRRYGDDGLARLRFIRHARDLGFSTAAIAALIELETEPNRPCHEARAIAAAELGSVRAKIERLQALEAELARIVADCAGDGVAGACAVMRAVADHGLCDESHQAGGDHLLPGGRGKAP
ncbi:MAG: helix-turn-helix domain-containing protein [Paracoccus sp. (in: a-proteobacteria)]|nr:helix-turn-helix domain-containing protein [Paracoccus sp. (in: a-proteobacteria)]